MLLTVAIFVAVLLQLAPHHAAQDYYYSLPGPPGYQQQPSVDPILNPFQTTAEFIPQHDPPYGVVPVYRTSYKLPVGEDIAPIDIHKLVGPPVRGHKKPDMSMYMTPKATSGHSPFSYSQSAQSLLSALKPPRGHSKPGTSMYMNPPGIIGHPSFSYPQPSKGLLSVVQTAHSHTKPDMFMNMKPPDTSGHSPFSYPQPTQTLPRVSYYNGLSLEEIYRQRLKLDSNRQQKSVDDAAWNITSPLKKAVDSFQEKFLAKYKEKNIEAKNMSEIVEMLKFLRGNSSSGDIAPFKKVDLHHHQLPRPSEGENKTLVSYVIKSNENYLLNNEPLPPKDLGKYGMAPAPAPASVPHGQQTTYPIPGSQSLSSILQGSMQNSYSGWKNITGTPGGQYSDKPLKDDKINAVWGSGSTMNNYGLNQYSVEYDSKPFKDPTPIGENVSGPLQDDQYVGYYDVIFKDERPDVLNAPQKVYTYDDKEYPSTYGEPNSQWEVGPRPDYDYRDPRPPQFYYNDRFQAMDRIPSLPQMIGINNPSEGLSYPDHPKTVHNETKPSSGNFISALIVPTSSSPLDVMPSYEDEQFLTQVDDDYINTEYYPSEPPDRNENLGHTSSEFNITTSFKYVYENHSYIPAKVEDRINVSQSSYDSTNIPIINTYPDYNHDTPYLPNYDNLFPDRMSSPYQPPLYNYPEDTFPTSININGPTDLSAIPYDYPDEEYWAPFISKGPKSISEIPTKNLYGKSPQAFLTPTGVKDTNSQQTNSKENPFSRPGGYLDRYLISNEESYSMPAQHDNEESYLTELKELDSDMKELDDYLDILPSSPGIHTASSLNRSIWEKLTQSQSTSQQDGHLAPQGNPTIPENHIWNTYPQYANNLVNHDYINFPSQQMNSHQVNEPDYTFEVKPSTFPQYGNYPAEIAHPYDEPQDEYSVLPDYNEHTINQYQDSHTVNNDQLPRTTLDTVYYDNQPLGKPTGLKNYLPPSLNEKQPQGKSLGPYQNEDRLTPSDYEYQPLESSVSPYQDKRYFPLPVYNNQPLKKLSNQGYFSPSDYDLQPVKNSPSPYQDRDYFLSPDDDNQQLKNPLSQYFSSPDYDNQPLKKPLRPYFSSPDYDNQPPKNPLNQYDDKDYFTSPDYDNQPLKNLLSLYEDKSYQSPTYYDNEPLKNLLNPYQDKEYYFSSADYDNQPLKIPLDPYQDKGYFTPPGPENQPLKNPLSQFQDNSKFSQSRQENQPLKSPSSPHQEKSYLSPPGYDNQQLKTPLNPYQDKSYLSPPGYDNQQLKTHLNSYQEKSYLSPPGYDNQKLKTPLNPYQDKSYFSSTDYDNQPLKTPFNPYQEKYFTPAYYDNQPVEKPSNSYYNTDDLNVPNYDTEQPYKMINPNQRPPVDSGNQALSPYREKDLPLQPNYGNNLLSETFDTYQNKAYSQPPRYFGDNSEADENDKENLTVSQYVHKIFNGTASIKYPNQKANSFVKTPQYPAVDDGLYKDEYFSSASYEYEFKKFHGSTKNVTKSPKQSPFPKSIITKVDFGIKTKETDVPKGLDIKNLFKHNGNRNVGSRNAREADGITENTGRSILSAISPYSRTITDNNSQSNDSIPLQQTFNEAGNSRQGKNSRSLEINNSSSKADGGSNTSQQVTSDMGNASKRELLQTRSSFESLDGTLVNKTVLLTENNGTSLNPTTPQTEKIEKPSRKNSLRKFQPMSLSQKFRVRHPR